MSTLKEILQRFHDAKGKSKGPEKKSVLQDWIEWMSEGRALFLESDAAIQREAEEIVKNQQLKADILARIDELQLISQYLIRYIKWTKKAPSADAHLYAQGKMFAEYGIMRAEKIPQHYKNLESAERGLIEYKAILEEIKQHKEQMKSLEKDEVRFKDDVRLKELRLLHSTEIDSMRALYEAFSHRLNEEINSYQRYGAKQTKNFSSDDLIQVSSHYDWACKKRYSNFDGLFHLLNAGAYYAQCHPDSIQILFPIFKQIACFHEVSPPRLEFSYQLHFILYTIKQAVLKNEREETISDLTLSEIQQIESALNADAAQIKPLNAFPFLFADVEYTTKHFSEDLHALHHHIEQVLMDCPEPFQWMLRGITDYLRHAPDALPHQKSQFLFEVNQILKDITELREIEYTSNLKPYRDSFIRLVLQNLQKGSFILFDCRTYKVFIEELKRQVCSRELLNYLRKENAMPKIFTPFQISSKPSLGHNEPEPAISNHVPELSHQEDNDQDAEWITVKYSRQKASKKSNKKPLRLLGSKKNNAGFFVNKSKKSTTETPRISVSLTPPKEVLDAPSLTNDPTPQEESRLIEVDEMPKQRVRLSTMIQETFQQLDPECSFIVGTTVLDLLSNYPLREKQDIDFVSLQHPLTHFGMLLNIIGVPGLLYLNRDNPNFPIECFVPHGIEKAHFFAQDLETRDFTICALYCNAQGEIFDPTGLGLNDYKNKILRFHKVRQATTYEESVQISLQCVLDDPIQILRCIKYIEKGYTPSSELVEALHRFTITEANLNKPHLYAVTRKLLQTFSPNIVIQRLNDYGLLQSLFGIEEHDSNPLDKLSALLQSEFGQTHPLEPSHFSLARSP